MFGQQFQTPLASAAKWIFFGFFGVILMGFLLGANLKDATWLNPGIASAQAEKTRMETAHQEAMNKLQEQLATAQTEAEIQKIQNQMKLEDAQFAYDIEVLNQDLVHRDIAFKTRMTVLTFLGGALSIAIVISAFLWVGSIALMNIRTAKPQARPVPAPIPPVTKTIQPLPEREPYDPWASPVYRYKKIFAARQEERQEREEITARMRAIKDPARMSKEEYNKRPLAGD